VRFVVYGPTTRILAAGPLKIVRERDSCGCVDWVPTPPARAPYTIQVDVYAPGPIHGAPLRTASSRPFTAS
jgi:hypothetical protein